ncbi:hypothetical protein BHM03_00029199 [Ensete ventricosum]|nr:hypothetical protein BHM03_00029199 [Ensete ventricosum]
MEQNPPKARPETPSIVPEKSTTPHLGEEHTSREPDTLSSDLTNSFRMQLRCINKWLYEVQKEVTKSKEEAGENPKHKSPFAPEIQDKLVPTNFGLPLLGSYDGSSDSTEHVAAFRAQMALYDKSDVLMCRVFPTTLKGPARMWYSRLKPASIISFDQLMKELEQNFLANARPKLIAASLLGIAQGREEPLAQFINRFTIETRAIPDVHPSLVFQAFMMGICSSKLFWSLVKKTLTTIPEMMQMVNHFIAAKTLIAGKCEEQKRPQTGQPRGPTSGRGDHLDRRSERDRQSHPADPVERQINVIVGGPAAGGDSASARKAYAKAAIEKRPRHHPDPEISFQPQGEECPYHDNRLIVTYASSTPELSG